MAAHDPKLEEELIMKLTDKVAFIQRLEKSVYNTDVNGLEGQKRVLTDCFQVYRCSSGTQICGSATFF